MNGLGRQRDEGCALDVLGVHARTQGVDQRDEVTCARPRLIKRIPAVLAHTFSAFLLARDRWTASRFFCFRISGSCLLRHRAMRAAPLLTGFASDFALLTVAAPSAPSQRRSSSFGADSVLGAEAGAVWARAESNCECSGLNPKSRILPMTSGPARR